MTLILTILNKYGIIHASDSALTDSLDQPAGESQKTYKINYLNAGLTVAGSYTVNGINMENWMNNFIQQQESQNISPLSEFAKNLKAELEIKMTQDEKQNGSIIHLAGYVEENGISHPEFWHIRNVTGIDLIKGDYIDFSDKFSINEDFWTRDYRKKNFSEVFKLGGYQTYINGFSPGRTSYNILQIKLSEFFYAVWSQPEWKFRPPQTLDETVLFAELNLNLIITLFIVSDYSAPFIGGPVQTLAIPCPPNMV